MFFVSGGVGLLFVVLMSALPKEKTTRAGSLLPRAEPARRTSVSEALSLFRKPSILGIMAAFSLASAALWIVFTFLPLFIFEHYHLSVESAAFHATFYMQIAGVVGDPFLGHISDKFSAHNLKNRFLFCAFAGVLRLPALAARGIRQAHSDLDRGFVGIWTGLCRSRRQLDADVVLCYVKVPARYGLRISEHGFLFGGRPCRDGRCLDDARYGLGLVIACGGGMFFLLAPVPISRRMPSSSGNALRKAR